jgi:hypothetical protein
MFTDIFHNPSSHSTLALVRPTGVDIAVAIPPRNPTNRKFVHSYLPSISKSTFSDVPQLFFTAHIILTITVVVSLTKLRLDNRKCVVPFPGPPVSDYTYTDISRNLALVSRVYARTCSRKCNDAFFFFRNLLSLSRYYSYSRSFPPSLSTPNRTFIDISHIPAPHFTFTPT